MFPLPRRHAIEEDELLLSYALRNRQNSYEGFSEFCNHFFLPGEYKNGDITPDEINSLENIKKNYLNSSSANAERVSEGVWDEPRRLLFY